MRIPHHKIYELQFSYNTLSTNKVLGLEWELSSDQIIFCFGEFIKRSIELKLSKSKRFQPFGFNIRPLLD